MNRKNVVNSMFVRELEIGDKVVHLQTLLYGRVTGKAEMNGIPNALLTVETACGKTLRMLRREEFGLYNGALPNLMRPAPEPANCNPEPAENVTGYEETSILDELV